MRRSLLVVCVWEWERLIITSVPRCCFKLFERDRGCSTGWYCYKPLAGHWCMAWPWTPRVKVKQHKSQMKRYEARHIMVQIQRDTMINLELQPSRIRAALYCLWVLICCEGQRRLVLDSCDLLPYSLEREGVVYVSVKRFQRSTGKLNTLVCQHGAKTWQTPAGQEGNYVFETSSEPEFQYSYINVASKIFNSLPRI